MKSKFQRVTSSVMRISLVMLLFLMTLIFAIIQGGFLLWFIFFIVLPFVCYSVLVFLTPLKNMKLERSIVSGHLEEGNSLKLHMVLKRKSSLPILFLAIQELQPTGIFEYVDERLMRKIIVVGFKKEISWDYTIKNLKRGHHELQGIQVGIADILGWVRKTNYVEAPKSIVVYPKIEPLYFNRSLSHEHGQFGYTNKKKQQHSTLVASIREYVPGDRMTWLHWPSFAKTGILYAKEFEFQQSEDVCVILDSSAGADFEGQVSFVASLMTAALKQKEQVSFLGAGVKSYEVEDVNSQVTLEKVMYYLATIQPNKYDVRLHYSNNHMISDANSLVLVTSNLTTAWVELLAKRATRGSEPTVYLIRPTKYLTFAEDEAIEQQAKARGIKIYYTERGQFASIKGGKSNE